jgi:hypothetical protein
MISRLARYRETAASVIAEVPLAANTDAAMTRLRWTLGSPWRCGSLDRWGTVLLVVSMKVGALSSSGCRFHLRACGGVWCVLRVVARRLGMAGGMGHAG